MNVGVVLYPGVNDLDVAAPLAVFEAARTTAVGPQAPPRHFQCFLLSDSLDVVETSGGAKLLPSDLATTAPGLDVLLVPGAAVDPPPERVEALVSLLRDRARDAQLVAGLGSGVFLLAHAGLLTGKRVTCHPDALAELKRFDAAVTVKERVVVDGNVATGAGRSAALDLALAVVRRLGSADLADAVARRLNHVPLG